MCKAQKQKRDFRYMEQYFHKMPKKKKKKGSGDNQEKDLLRFCVDIIFFLKRSQKDRIASEVCFS